MFHVYLSMICPQLVHWLQHASALFFFCGGAFNLKSMQLLDAAAPLLWSSFKTDRR